MPPAPGNGRLGPRKPKPAPKYTVAVPDAKESTRSRQSTIPTPDQSDRNRTAPQQVRDRAAVAKSVSDSRRKAIAEAHAARPTLASRVPGAVKHIVIDNSATVQGPRVKVITPQQALELAKRGAKVRHLTPAEANDIGATMQASIGGGSTGLTRAARATMQGIVQDPKHSLPATARGFRDSLTGIPSSVVALIVNPQGTAKAAVKDYSRRYGGINQPGGVQKMADRISKEGAAPELLDAATLATGVGSAAGKALTIPAKAGKLGKTLEHVATAERPAKRVSGGKAIPQAKSENLIVAAAQTARDTRKVTKNQAKVARAEAGGQRVGAIEQEAARRSEIPAKGRVAARMVAKEKGRDLHEMKREQRVEVDQGTRRNLAGLTKHERAGFKFAMQLGIPGDAKIARATLEKRLKDITEARTAEGVTVPKVLAKSNDEAAVIQRMLGSDLERVFTPRLRKVVEAEQSRERRLAGADPGLDPVQSQLRRYAPQAAHLGVERGKAEIPQAERSAKAAELEKMAGSLEDEAKRQRESGQFKFGQANEKNVEKLATAMRDDAKALRSGKGKQDFAESPAEYLRRVKKAAADAGLERPGYFLSQKRPRGGYGDRAIGGSRAIADPKTYTGALFRTGREDVRPEVFQQGLSRNIKRRHNWNRVAQNFEDNTFDWARNSTVSRLLDELDHRGIDPESVALWNPRLYRAERAAREDATDLERTGHGEEPVPQGLGEAVDTSATLLKDLAKRPEDFKKAGWSLIPRAVYDEIHADTRPSGAVARGWDIAKGKQSRVLLGLSPSWLQFQVVSNALLTGMAGTGPVDIVKAQVWWHKLPDEQKAAIEPYIGTGAFHDSISQTKLGAARTRSQKVNEMIDGYRAMKTTPFMQKVGRGNPLDMLFRADAAQNNIFRTAVLYSQVKRDAYKRMGQSTKLMAGAQTRFMHALDLGPQHIMDTIVNDQRALERHAQHVVDFLGDYSTFTAAERRVFQRGVMFYGFLRFSLRFTFLTMPIKHPIMSGVMAQLGRLQVDEVRKILGGDELPFALGKLYFTKDGKLKSIDLSRANPAMNAITNFRGPKDLLGFLPPIVGAVIDQAYAKSGFKQKDWRVEGENQPRTGQQGYGVENRARIFLGQMLSLASLYRTAMAATQPGPKGDDSLLFSPRPTNYVDPQTVASIARSQQNLPASAGGRALQQLVPFIPRNDNAPELAASIRARNGQSSGAAPVSIIAPPSTAPPTREQLEARLRQKMNRSPSNASSEELRLRQKLRQR